MTNSLQRNRERGKGQRILSPLDPALLSCSLSLCGETHNDYR